MAIGETVEGQTVNGGRQSGDLELAENLGWPDKQAYLASPPGEALGRRD